MLKLIHKEKIPNMVYADKNDNFCIICRGHSFLYLTIFCVSITNRYDPYEKTIGKFRTQKELKRFLRDINRGIIKLQDLWGEENEL